MQEYYLIDPQTYDDQFWWKKDDIEFWKSTPTISNTTILELAAGTGRLAIPLIKEGVNYTGLELSKKYTQYANLKFESLNPIIAGDMRKFNFNQSYDIIFIGFNSFLHLLTEKDVVKCFKSIQKHMHSNSRLYIDVFMPSPSFLYRSPSSKVTVLEFFDSQKKCLSTIEEKIDYNTLNEIVSVNWKYKNDKNIYYKQFDFQMKIYYPDTIHRLLEDNGFCVNNLWGDYAKAPLTDESPLQIYELSRSELI